MYNKKHLKPNLMDPLIDQKIMKTLGNKKQISEDYWEPTRVGLFTFWEKYILPNIWIIIVILIVVIFLIYRYRSVKSEREEKEMLEKYNAFNAYNHSNYRGDYNYYHPHHPHYPNPRDLKNSKKDKDEEKSMVDQYTQMLLDLYEFQKEQILEPSKPSNRDYRKPNRSRKPSRPYHDDPYNQPYTKDNSWFTKSDSYDLIYPSRDQRKPSLAYPMHPYGDGILTPSKSSRRHY